jgi:transposase
VFTVGSDGVAETVVTGLPWRTEVCQRVFEEAAVDCGRALAAWSDSRRGKRKGKRVGFPRFKKKTGVVPSFRLRNKHPKGAPAAIRVGDNDRPRSITLPGIGQIGVHDDTRRLRRMLARDRAKILFATVSHHAGRWCVSLNVEAAELHPAHLHPARDPHDGGGWVGVDRGLSAFLVTADRWYPSSRLCPQCGAIRADLTLADRVFTCGCGHCADRDSNAAVNLARWAQAHEDPTLDPRTPKHGGRATNARRRDGADQHPTCAGETSPDDAGTDVHTAPAA